MNYVIHYFFIIYKSGIKNSGLTRQIALCYGCQHIKLRTVLS